MDNKVGTDAREGVSWSWASPRCASIFAVSAKRGGFDEGIGETEDAAAAGYAFWARAQVSPSLPLIAAGFFLSAVSCNPRLLPRSQPQQLVLVGPAVSHFQLAEVPKDTLVVHGEEDDVVPLDAVMTWARPQGLPVTVFPGKSHRQNRNFSWPPVTELKAVVKGAIAENSSAQSEPQHAFGSNPRTSFSSSPWMAAIFYLLRLLSITCRH